MDNRTGMDSSDSSDFEDDLEGREQDAYLGGLRLSMRSIRTHARKEIANAQSVNAREDMKERLESSTLRLLQGEKMFLETASIVAGIVEDMCEPDEDSADEDENGNQLITVSRFNDRHNDDKPRPRLPNPDQLVVIREKMAELFDTRMDNFRETLTKEHLHKDPQSVALRKEIGLGEEDYDRKASSEADRGNPLDDNTEYPPEDLDGDESVLPSTDPITKKPMTHPRRNKFCNHIFQEESLIAYIKDNPTGRCPMRGCRNDRPLHMDHFITDAKLTQRIRAKNNKY